MVVAALALAVAVAVAVTVPTVLSGNSFQGSFCTWNQQMNFALVAPLLPASVPAVESTVGQVVCQSMVALEPRYGEVQCFFHHW